MLLAPFHQIHFLNMPLDINLFRTDRGGNPDVVRESQRRRFKPPEAVDEVWLLIQ